MTNGFLVFLSGSPCSVLAVCPFWGAFAPTTLSLSLACHPANRVLTGLDSKGAVFLSPLQFYFYLYISPLLVLLRYFLEMMMRAHNQPGYRQLGNPNNLDTWPTVSRHGKAASASISRRMIPGRVPLLILPPGLPGYAFSSSDVMISTRQRQYLETMLFACVLFLRSGCLPHRYIVDRRSRRP
jgi:hypothetical protein